MNELAAALYAILNSDAELGSIVKGVHNTAAEDGAEYPYLVFQQVYGEDEYALSQRIRTSYSFQIRVVDKGYSNAAIGAALARVDELLMDASLVAGNIYCRRQSLIPYMLEYDSGEVYQAAGAVYRIELVKPETT